MEELKVRAAEWVLRHQCLHTVLQFSSAKLLLLPLKQSGRILVIYIVLSRAVSHPG